MVGTTTSSLRRSIDSAYRSFLCQAPLTLLAIVSVYFTLQLPPVEDADWRAKLRRIDFLGAFMLVSSVFTLLLGLDRGSNITWKSPLTPSMCCQPFYADLTISVSTDHALHHSDLDLLCEFADSPHGSNCKKSQLDIHNHRYRLSLCSLMKKALIAAPATMHALRKKPARVAAP